MKKSDQKDQINENLPNTPAYKVKYRKGQINPWALRNLAKVAIRGIFLDGTSMSEDDCIQEATLVMIKMIKATRKKGCLPHKTLMLKAARTAVYRCLERMPHMQPLNFKPDDIDSGSGSNEPIDPHPGPLELAARKDTIETLLSHLTRQEASILTRLCGLDGGRPLSVREIAKKRRLPHKVVVKLRNNALSKLRALPNLSPITGVNDEEQ